MTPIRVAATTAVMHGADGDASVGDLPVSWSEDGHRSVWRPSDAERVRIAAGANVEIHVWAQHVHPMSVEITDEQQHDELGDVLPERVAVH